MKPFPASKIALALFPLLLSAWGCGGGEDESNLQIRQGSTVSASSRGPERLSTVGLVGFGDEGSYTCSAAIINANTLVTAAHCVPAGSKLYAFFGTDLDRAKQSDFITVASQRAHPDYKPSGRGLPAHDVAIIKLNASIPSGFVAAPLLPSDSLLKENDQVLLAGYGITEYGDDSGLLRATPATFVGLDAIGRLQINDPQKRGACSGDSGGPLFARVNGTYYVAGVLSGGPIPCRGINVYTSLAQHADFVR